jgi:hypothetical protein
MSRFSQALRRLLNRTDSAPIKTRRYSVAIAPILAALTAVAACVLQAAIYGVPIPAVHDEFSYILAADTFRHGRLTNPTHPMWQHFESMHILQQPSYSSKYPPGQGAFLALGWVIGGHPIVGVWLGIGLAAGAITWMLRAYLPATWALIGGIVAAFHLGFSGWGWSYWGGGVAAAGGALFLGAAARLMHKIRGRDAAVLAAGLVLLAVSRPFEGALLCMPVAGAMVLQAFRVRIWRVQIVQFAVVPAVAILVPAGAALAYFDARVTGNPLRLPYMEHSRQYAITPVLIFQKPMPEPEYRHPVLREFYTQEEYNTYLKEQSREGWSLCVKAKLQMWWEIYLGYGLSLSLIFLPVVILLSRRTRFALTVCIFVLGFITLFETWGFTHYTAPVAGLVYLLAAQSLRCFSLLHWRGWQFGRFLVAGWVIICLIEPALSLLPRYHDPSRDWAAARAAIERDLRSDGRQHLVIVRYGPNHSVHDEWVYNEADINSATIVWAREMNPEKDAELLDYYADRVVWLLDEDGDAVHISKIRDSQTARIDLQARSD